MAQQHLLLFQRTQIQILASIWQLITIYNSSFRCPLLVSMGTACTCAHTYIWILPWVFSHLSTAIYVMNEQRTPTGQATGERQDLRDSDKSQETLEKQLCLYILWKEKGEGTQRHILWEAGRGRHHCLCCYSL